MAIPFDSLTSLAAASLGPALLASLRMLGMLMLMPGLSGSTFGWRMRGALALLLGGLAGTGDRPMEGSWAAAAGMEFVFGAMIGCGLSLFVAGLRLAGELIDREIGTGDALAFDHWAGEAEGPLGPCTRLLSGLAVATVLFGTSRGGIPVLEAILDLYVAVPPGQAFFGDGAIHWLVSALQHSADLGIRAALPVLSVMAILGWAQGLLQRAAPLTPSLTLVTTVRPLLGLAVLVATFGGALETTSGRMFHWITAWAGRAE